MKIVHVTALCAVLAVSGCASNPSNPMDPLEPLNRKIYAFNDNVDHYVAKPVAQAYHNVTPQPFRIAVNNFFDNILDAYSAVNNALRAEPKKALSDLMRVAINTTFGVFGLVDFATPAGLPSNKTTLGDTLATWGWKNSSYFVMPFFGPSTIRDGTGTTVTLYYSPDRKLYNGPAAANTADAFYVVSKRERLLGVEESVQEAAIDPYSYTRDAFLQIRAKQVGGTQPTSPQDEIDIDQLMAPEPSSAPVANKPAASSAQ
jgi:phospholipid-binding lipoprotein MlaA